MRGLKWLWVSLGAVLGLIVLAGVVMTLGFSASGRIYPGASIEDVAVGGLAKSQAAELMSAWAQKAATGNLVLTANDSKWMGALPDFGARFKWQEAVDQAYAIGREGNFLERVILVASQGKIRRKINVAVAVDKRQVEKTIKKIAKYINRPHKNARLVEVDGRMAIQQDSVGIKIDEKLAIADVTRAICQGRLMAPLPVIADNPDVAASDVSGITTMLARFTTRFNPGKRERTSNLRLAAKSIDGAIIKPGAEFSYNDAVGPRVIERGFKEAIVFVKGKLEPGVGGGICQVSSTLYNAVLLSGLQVVERHTHSRTVPYVVAGRDATVAYGQRDFRFKNPYQTSIGILTHFGKSSLTVDIYGAQTDKKDVVIFTGPVKYTRNTKTMTVFDPTLRAGARKVVDKGSSGARVTVYKKTKAADGTWVTEKVSTDHYSTQPIVIGVGPAKKVASAPATEAEPTVETIPVSDTR